MHYYDVLTPKQCTGSGFDTLLSLGWYPMGQTIFTTSHLFKEGEKNPERVHWIRYRLSSLEERTSHGRIRRKNGDFTREYLSPFYHDPEWDRLYEKYIQSVDFDGYPSIERATHPLNLPNIYDAMAIMVRHVKRLVSCGIFYVGENSAASILHFYDPEYRPYSPGKYLILGTVDYCRQNGLEWYYPGYIIEGNPRMDYKLFLGSQKAQFYDPNPSPLAGSWKLFPPGS